MPLDPPQAIPASRDLIAIAATATVPRLQGTTRVGFVARLEGAISKTRLQFAPI